MTEVKRTEKELTIDILTDPAKLKKFLDGLSVDDVILTHCDFTANYLSNLLNKKYPDGAARPSIKTVKRDFYDEPLNKILICS